MAGYCVTIGNLLREILKDPPRLLCGYCRLLSVTVLLLCCPSHHPSAMALAAPAPSPPLNHVEECFGPAILKPKNDSKGGIDGRGRRAPNMIQWGGGGGFCVAQKHRSSHGVLGVRLSVLGVRLSVVCVNVFIFTF